MNRVGEIQKQIRAGQPFPQFSTGQAVTTQRSQVVLFVWRRLIKKGISACETVGAKLELEVRDACFVALRVMARWQKFKPDRVLPQSAQPEDPLQRDRKIPAALEVFRCEAAPDKNGHRGTRKSRIAQLPTRNLQSLLFLISYLSEK